MAQMPFSPCEASSGADCADQSFQMLTKIFGDMVPALAQGADPNTVASATNILATMFGIFNSGLMVVGALLVTYVAIVGVTNTAQDGEAMGKDWSSVYTTLRIITGVGALLPTASGYSFIQLFVMMVTLWGVGFANSVYKAGMSLSMITPSGLVSGSMAPGQMYGMGQFAKDYTLTSYCAHSTNFVYGPSDGVAGVRVGASAERVTSKDGATNRITPWRDTNPETNLAGGQPICGEVVMSSYTRQPRESEEEKLIEAMKQDIQTKKLAAAEKMKRDIDAWVGTWPKAIDQPGWENVNSARLNEIIKAADSQVVSAITESINNGGDGVENELSQVLDTMVERGWAAAGGWYQRVGVMRSMIMKATSMPVGSGGGFSLNGLPDDERANLLRMTMERVPAVVFEKASAKVGADNETVQAADMLPTDVDDFDVRKVDALINGKMDSWSNGVMRHMVGYATGKTDNLITDTMMAGCGLNGEIGGSLMRMKCLGDYIVSADLMVSTLRHGLILGSNVLHAALASASSVKVLGTGFSGEAIGRVVKDFLNDTILAWLSTVGNYLSLLGFYFSVVLPSLPYAIFLVVVVGWLLGVLQAMLGVSLWAVMLMTPSRTFIGSQQQGLLLLLTVFARPALAIVGLFAAMLVSDPIIDYIATEFFNYRGAIVGSGGIVGWFAEIITFMNWFIVFAGILGPVLYMIYGLPQALPGVVLSWIGAGITPMGETTAASEARNGGSQAGRNLIEGGKSGGGGGSGSPPATPKLPGDPGGSQGGKSPSTLVNPQGAHPSMTMSGAGQVRNADGGYGKMDAGGNSEFTRQHADMPGSARLGQMIGTGARLALGGKRQEGAEGLTAMQVMQNRYHGRDDNLQVNQNPAYKPQKESGDQPEHQPKNAPS